MFACLIDALTVLQENRRLLSIARLSTRNSSNTRFFELAEESAKQQSVSTLI